MKTLKILILACALAATMAAQSRLTATYGTMTAPTPATGTFALNTAASGGFSAAWIAYKLIPSASKTISKIKTYTHTVTGTLSAGDLVCDVYTNVSGSPGSSLASSSTVTTVPTAAGLTEFTGFSQAVTARTMYWIVSRNANATPTSNSWTERYWSGVGFGAVQGPFGGVKTSTNSGGAWTVVASAVPILRVEYSDGTFDGFTYESTLIAGGATTPANHKIRSTAEAGAVFVAPGAFVVSGCAVTVGKLGTPTGNLSCKVYSDDGTTITLVATSSNSYAPAEIDSTARPTPFWFASNLNLIAGLKYRAVLSESTQSDSTSNYFGAMIMSQASDAGNLAVMPANGTWRGTFCASSCTTRANWTDDTGNIPVIGLMLEPTGEVSTTGGSGGAKGFTFN